MNGFKSSKVKVDTSTKLTNVKEKPHTPHCEKGRLVSKILRFPVRKLNLQIFFRIFAVRFCKPVVGRIQHSKKRFVRYLRNK